MRDSLSIDTQYNIKTIYRKLSYRFNLYEKKYNKNAKNRI